MCGIAGYIGHREAYPIVINGLKRLEYRGYDSAGVLMFNEDASISKTKGKVADLENTIRGKNWNKDILIKFRNKYITKEIVPK